METLQDIRKVLTSAHNGVVIIDRQGTFVLYNQAAGLPLAAVTGRAELMDAAQVGGLGGIPNLPRHDGRKPKFPHQRLR